MADTKSDIILPKQTWIDLYAASSIVVGTKVAVTNKGTVPITLAIKATTPTDSTFGMPVVALSTVYVDAGASGLWAHSLNDKDGSVLVQE